MIKSRLSICFAVVLFGVGCSSSQANDAAAARDTADDSDDAYQESNDHSAGGDSDNVAPSPPSGSPSYNAGNPADPGAALPNVSNDGDEYENVGTNPFVLTAHDPFSTFAADVDTASYDIFRRDINFGILPDPLSVRLEDYVNYFDYDYPAPPKGAEHPFAISLAALPNVLDRPTTLLRIGIQATKPPPFAKKPANIVFLVDVSGSMTSSDKLPLVQYLLDETIEMLAPGDTISIVTYAGSTRVALGPTPVIQASTIRSVIADLAAGGSTNGAGGINLAYQQAEAGFIEGGINHVILCTDGDFNVGVSSDTELVDLIEEKRATGITLTALGFGIGNLNDSMMEKVSNAGNGIYSVITSQSQASAYVEERLLSTLVHVAKDMKIQVELNPELVKAYRLLGYENRAILDDDFRDDEIDAGEVGAGHRVTALYEIVLGDDPIPTAANAPEPEGGAPSDGAREVSAADLVLVKVRYKEVGASAEASALEVRKALAASAVHKNLEASDADLKWTVAIAAFAEVLKESPYADRDELDLIGSILSAQADRDAARRELVDLFDEARQLMVATP